MLVSQAAISPLSLAYQSTLTVLPPVALVTIALSKAGLRRELAVAVLSAREAGDAKAVVTGSIA